MIIDPLRLTIAAVPLAAYLLLLAVLNFRRRPFLTNGGNDLFALGLALSGVIFVGPLELLRPEAAAAEFGNYVWLSLLFFYWLWVLLFVLVARPRLVIYNISAEELHPVLAEAAAELDAQARWAADSLALPTLGVQLHIDDFPFMRNVSLSSSGSRQSLDGWQRLAGALAHKLRPVRVQSNRRALSFLLAATILMAASLSHMLAHPMQLAEAAREVFQY
jgi:hypothetical protein